MKRIWTLGCLALSLALTACGGGGGGSLPPPVNPESTTFSMTRTNVALALPESNGYSCSVTIPPNSAPAGATLTVSVPAAGAVLAPITTVGGVATTTNPPATAAITATSSVNVSLNPALALVCTPALPTITGSGAAQYVDPTDPGSYLGPTIVATENLVAGEPQVLGYL